LYKLQLDIVLFVMPFIYSVYLVKAQEKIGQL